ncbi:MAG: acyl--CoA ligase [Hyphomicrobiales bacterium]|nr:acyl--CoA ligase [Hyphomicrobiales bacterium]
MILNDPSQRTAPIGGRTTLDGMLQRWALQQPHAVALIDPPNRASFTDGEPRRLTYAETDRMVSAIAGRLRRMGLRTDAVVGIQVANTVESVLAFLGVLRAGLIAMPLPLLWRRADAVAALGRVGVSALIVSGRLDRFDHYELAMQIAAEVFPIRFVCGLGEHAPDGLVSFDDLFTARALDPLPALDEERTAAPGPAAHLAAITWDVGADGLIPVARSHAELIAAGLVVVLESGLGQESGLLTTMTMSSFAGLATAVVPWLIRGGALALHQPFDPEAFLTQIDMCPVDTIIVPGSLAAELAEVGRLTSSAARVIGVWRAPERMVRAQAWPGIKATMVDVQVFGEIGFVAARRGEDGLPPAIPFGVVHAPRNGGTVVAIEISATTHATVALRGPMVPRVAFPPGAERSHLAYLEIPPNGFVDTGYACRPDCETMVLRAPPKGIVTVGGYRLATAEIEALVGRAEDGAATLAMLPDVLAGHRLAGIAADHDTVERALESFGANALLVDAFRAHGRQAA